MTDVKNIELDDWFAGQALMGILSNSQYPTQSSGEPFDQYAARVTDTAYKICGCHDQARTKKEKGNVLHLVMLGAPQQIMEFAHPGCCVNE